jgi:unsaturated rhamnogalacturonyl hydrolase
MSERARHCLVGFMVLAGGFLPGAGLRGLADEPRMPDAREFPRTPPAAAAPVPLRDPLAWSLAMARSESVRAAQGRVAPRWTYTLGLMALAYVRLGEALRDEEWRGRGEALVTQFIDEEGAIRGYRAEAWNLDLIAPGKVLLSAHARHGDPRLRRAIERLRRQLDAQPRTPSGGFWHKASYPNQMWLDGMFMAQPFLADYARCFGEPSLADEVIAQMVLIDRRTYEPTTGLHRHAWDESGQETWAEPVTGRSPGHWSRGSGWWLMALVDVLELLPAAHPRRPELEEALQRTAAGLVRWQDPDTGLWWQVTDQPGRERNYLEASASAMFAYSLAKAVNRGWLPADRYAVPARRAFAGLTGRLVRVESDGTLTLTQCCAVAGLGRTNEAGRARDGSFEYYVSEPVVDNDPKGVAPFIMAGIEIERLESKTR